MITRLLIFAVASIASSICFSDEFAIKVKLDGKHLLSAQCLDIDRAVKSNFSTVVFRPIEYTSPYRDGNEEIDLQGNIVVEIQGVPEIRLKSLHLKNAPEATVLKWCDPNWKLHPDDAAAIAAHFETLARAPDYDYFDIKINGYDSFRGVLFEKPSHENFSGLLSIARVMTVGNASRNYIYPSLKDQDLTFNGDVEISFNGLAAMPLQSLRLIYAPGDKEISYYEDKGWKLEPDDAAQIAKQYQSIISQQQADARAQAWDEWWAKYLPILGRLIALVFLLWLLSNIVKKRIARQLQSRSVVASPEARWWDE